MEFVTKEELEMPRSAAQLLAWAEEKISSIGTTDSGKKAIRFRKGLCKTLVEEALPLGIFCAHYFKASRCVTINHIVGNQNYDAIVTDKRLRKSPITYLEVTQAHEGQNEHLRMIKLERKGSVNVLGRVKKRGTKHTGITVEIENEAKSHNDVVAAEKDRIAKAVERKAHNSYPKGTGLIIVFDDHIAFRDSEDKEDLKQFAKKNLQSKLTNFCLAALVGWSKQTYVEFSA
jgi:hypothetical protein